jgi:DNA-binding MarR family transcriptional regulator
LVTRQPSQDDRRATFVGLSRKGVELMDRILPGHFARVAALMQDLTATERAEFRRLLAKVREGVGRVKELNLGIGCAHEGCAGG